MAFSTFAALRSSGRSWGVFGLAAAAGAWTFGGDVARQLAVPASADTPEGALNPKEFIPLKIINKEKLTHDTYKYRLELPGNRIAGGGVASCLVTKAMIPDAPGQEPKLVIRPYTPTSSKDARGYMDLVVKVYPTGKMSKYLGGLEVGDNIEIKGPIPKIQYTPNMKKHVAMIAGGTGITPMIQVIDEILANPEDKTTISLMYGSQTVEDIILKDHIDRLVTNYPGRIKVFYYVSRGKWAGERKANVALGVGNIDKQAIESFIPAASEDVMVMVCGPPGMMNAISGNKASPMDQGELKGALKDLGYTKEQVFKF